MAKKMNKACWKGYEMVGTKKKGGRISLGEEGDFHFLGFWLFCYPLQTFSKCKIKTPQSVK